jgi:hypothetical protein
VLKNVFKQLQSEIELHVVTDKLIPFPLGISKKSQTILDKLGTDYSFYEWKFDSFASQITWFDLALIPLDKSKKIMWHKPENKLLFFWQLGMPAITSDSPAYKRVMDTAGIDMYAANDKEWVDKILKYKNMKESERDVLLDKMKRYIAAHHSKEMIINQWKKIFQLN